MVDNHGVENLQDTLSKSHYAGAAYNVCLVCSEDDMVEGGHDSSGAQDIFPPLKKLNLWAYSGYYKNAQGQLVKDGSPICKLNLF